MPCARAWAQHLLGPCHCNGSKVEWQQSEAAETVPPTRRCTASGPVTGGLGKNMGLAGNVTIAWTNGLAFNPTNIPWIYWMWRWVRARARAWLLVWRKAART